MFPVCRHFLYKMYVFLGIVVWRRRPKTDVNFFLFWSPFDEKCSSAKEEKTHNTDSRHMPCNTATFDSNPSVCKHFQNENGPARTGNSMPSKKRQPVAWLTQGSRPRWACRSQRRSGGCRGSARRARWCHTNAWARKPEACVAAKSGFFSSSTEQ